ncbi:MAG: hypothetical protein AAGE99_01610 [Chlamydiota bacterium]
MDQSIERLYPFLILAGVYILKGLYKRGRKRREREEKIIPPLPRPSPKPEVEPTLAVRIGRMKPAELSEVPDQGVFDRKGQPRIGRLVGGLKSKKTLLLLSEILVNKHDLK